MVKLPIGRVDPLVMIWMRYDFLSYGTPSLKGPYDIQMIKLHTGRADHLDALWPL